jgi:uncharacterized membrane protein YfcA
MLTKIIGAALGAKAAQNTSSIGGPFGAAIGAAAPAIIARLSIPAMIAIAAGGYAYKKFSEKKDNTAETKQPPATSTAPAAA